ncbi:MAG: lipopolysaccharide biosynthesis protein, partial [Bacteroidia bacterium]|nr:lipopolysaccharide biosynthesis protein [Bacteroidia bacterium]
MSSTADNNKRIAKNTVYLYFRTILIMLVTLYTSRVILKTLGVQDYGIQNAVGGVVMMFGLLTQALSASISRYITFELGKKDANILHLKTIFTTSVRIQITFGAIIILIGETLGLWFLNYKMNIPTDRMVAANWVWQCSLLTFVINLISVPYNALIIAHEHMRAYALVSILDAVLKLIICYLLVVSPWDKLSTYAVLLVLVALTIRLIYGFYCSAHFDECSYVKKSEKALTKQMFSFAGFSLMNNSVSILNHQGLSLLVNIFFGVFFNAA